MIMSCESQKAVPVGRRSGAWSLCLSAALLCLGRYAAASDPLTMTMTYPSPSGVYHNVIVTSNTVLARDGESMVGIGTTLPTQKLTVDGNVSMNSLALNPLATAPPNAVEGMLYYGATDESLYIRKNSGWARIIMLGGETLGQRILPTDWSVQGDWDVVGDGGAVLLKVTEKTPQRGLYIVSWGGEVDVDAKDGKYAKIQVKYGDRAVILETIYEDDDDAKDGTPTVHEFEGSTLVQCKKGYNYNFRIVAVRKGKTTQNSSIIRAGAWIKVEMLLPL